MSNNISYNGGSTLLEVGGILPALSGASPTSYFCGNLIWKQLVQQKNIPTMNSEEESSRKKQEVSVSPSTIFVPTEYSQLHVMACQGNSINAGSYFEQCSSFEINKQDHNGNTPLIWACNVAQEETVQILLDNHAYVNAQNFVGETSLFLAASYGYDNIVSMLLEHGANPNICNIDGTSPLHMAASNGHETTLEILVSSGAYLNCQDDCGDTPLHYAIRDDQFKIVDQLVTRCNADVNIFNEDQETPLDLASCLGMNEKYVQFLSSNGSSSSSMMEAAWI